MKNSTEQTPEKIANNCYLIGNDVYSYTTKVGTIVGAKLVVFGTYSNATTQHMYKVARKKGLTIVKNSDKPKFDKFEYGVKVKPVNGKLIARY